MFSQMSAGGHQHLFIKNCEKTGLKAVVAVHDQAFGPAFGGTRIIPYDAEYEATADALRLSRAMTLKAACAGVPVGGAKGVIMGDPGRKSDFLAAYADFVESLGGRFVTGPDVNLSSEDAALLAKRCQYIVGLSEPPNDTGTMTAYGVLMSMRAAVQFTLEKSSFQGLRVAIQGLGSVGWRLAEMLHQEGAELIVADVNEEKAAEAARRFGARVVPTSEVHRAPADIFAPCARGGVLTQLSLPEIPAKIIAGAANNQLLDETADGALARALGKTYCPDFVANGGGLIAVYHEFIRAPAAELKSRVERIYDTSMHIFKRAKDSDSCHLTAALAVAADSLSTLKSNHAGIARAGASAEASYPSVRRSTGADLAEAPVRYAAGAEDRRL